MRLRRWRLFETLGRFSANKNPTFYHFLPNLVVFVNQALTRKYVSESWPLIHCDVSVKLNLNLLSLFESI
jgi:hypothetical protein